MFDSRVLETAIGLLFVFIIFSTLCASVREGIEAWLKTRATYLERGLRELLSDPSGQGLLRKVYQHPLIYGLYRGDFPADAIADGKRSGGNLPSYIPSTNFALALMDIVASGPALLAPGDNRSLAPAASPVAMTVDSLRAGASRPENEPIARAILSALDFAQGDIDRARAVIEHWFDSTMDRVSGWYRRSTQWIVFGMGLILAVVLNVNSIQIADYLYRTDVARAKVVERAGTLIQDAPAIAPLPTKESGGADAKLTDASAALYDKTLQLPIGWNYLNFPAAAATDRQVFTFWLQLIAGWLITAVAATLGAPFWFDVLNKVMIIRSTVKPHQKSPEEASEDRQKKSDPSGSLLSIVPPRLMAAQGVVDRRQTPQLSYGEPVEVDGCGHAEAPQTEDKDLPPAQGGIK